MSSNDKNHAMSIRRRVKSLLCGCSVLVIIFILLFYITSEGSEQCCAGEIRGMYARQYRVRSNNCEVMDLAVVVRGYNASRDAALLIKSVLLYRQNPIRWHFIADPIAKHILNTLLRTWHLYGVAYKFYDIEKSSRHTSQSTQKPDDPCHFFIDALPNSVEKVIALEPTILLTADIFHLWEVFHNMKTHGSVLGIVRAPNDSGGEFRTGVMLLDLKYLRKKRWSSLWARAMETEASAMETEAPAVLVSNNILSRLYTKHHSLFFNLNPGWNVHPSAAISSHTLPCSNQQFTCAGAFEHSSSTMASHLKEVFLKYDGNMLRERLIDCESGEEFDKNAMDYRSKMSIYHPPCTDFKREGSQERRTHPFYLEYNYVSEDPYDVTLLLHVTLDRLVPMLEPMCKHWEGPMSIAIFANDSEVSDFLNLISSSPVISSRQNIGYHIVYKEGIFYPINPLRIAALENVRTPYVFFNDLDFLPSFGLYSHLKDTIERFKRSDTVLVVPALETYEDPQDFPFPRNKSAVVKLISQNRVFQFHVSKYIRGHAPTDYVTWKRTAHPYEIQWQPGYEPYLVANVNITPFDPRFVSRGHNKVSHAEQLYYERYRFLVVPNGFILHLPHTLSRDSVNQKANERYRECFTRRMQEWRSEMVQVYGYEPYLVSLYKIWNALYSSYDTSI